MKRLRTDKPYYKDGGASYCSVTKITKEEPYAREMIKIRGATAPVFSIMSYNILAEANLTDEGQYNYTPSWALPFDYRLQNIVKEIEFYQPDIVCLQEVDHPDEIASHFKSIGYLSEFHGRGGRYPEGCQVLYKEHNFDLIDIQKIRFNQLVEEYAVPRREFKRGNIGQLLVFNVRGFNIPLLIGNTHLYWDPSFEHVKVAQAHYLMHSVDKMKKKHNVKFPTALCGDFNSDPASRVYELICRGLPKDRANRKDVLLHAHQSQLVSAYACRKEPHTNFASVFRGTLDYVFYSKESLSLVSLLEEVDNEYPPLKQYTAAPNPSMPSDHVPIMATFALEPQSQ